MTGPRTYALRLGLGPVPATADELWEVLEGPLEPFEARLTHHRSDVQLLLTIAAADVWVAVLSAMAAVTDCGYPVLDLEAHPVQEPNQSDAVAGPNSLRGITIS